MNFMVVLFDLGEGCFDTRNSIGIMMTSFP